MPNSSTNDRKPIRYASLNPLGFRLSSTVSRDNLTSTSSSKNLMILSLVLRCVLVFASAAAAAAAAAVTAAAATADYRCFSTYSFGCFRPITPLLFSGTSSLTELSSEADRASFICPSASNSEWESLDLF